MMFHERFVAGVRREFSAPVAHEAQLSVLFGAREPQDQPPKAAAASCDVLVQGNAQAR